MDTSMDVSIAATAIESEINTYNDNGDEIIKEAASNQRQREGANETPEQTVWRGTLSDLESVVYAAVAAAGIGDGSPTKLTLSPCVLVIGSTAGLDLTSVADTEIAGADIFNAVTAAASTNTAAAAIRTTATETSYVGSAADNGAPMNDALISAPAAAAAAEAVPFSLSAFDDFLLDLDGVLWQGSAPISGALEAARVLLRECATPTPSKQSSQSTTPSSPSSLGATAVGGQGRPRRVYFVTNNSAKTRVEYAATLSERLGVSVLESQVITSGWAAAQLLASSAPGTIGQKVSSRLPSTQLLREREQEHRSSRSGDEKYEKDSEITTSGLPRTVFALGSPALTTELLAAGMRVITPSDHGISATTVMTPEMYAAMELDPRVDAVVIGWCPEAWHYAGFCLASAYANEHHRLQDDDDNHNGRGLSSEKGSCAPPPHVDLVATNPDFYNVLSETTARTDTASANISPRKSRVRRLPENGCAVAFVESTLGSSSGSSGSSSSSDSPEQRRFVAAGKPSHVLASLLTASLDLNPSRTLMVNMFMSPGFHLYFRLVSRPLSFSLCSMLKTCIYLLHLRLQFIFCSYIVFPPHYHAFSFSGGRPA
jgi:ribonucleotide monophosphatase NagD (HAD superfamily)